jgi:hypothetical protein
MIETKLIQCKMKLDKLAVREPMTGKQMYIRMLWERVRTILIRRYNRYD